jgi:hypothetical protein
VYSANEQGGRAGAEHRISSERLFVILGFLLIINLICCSAVVYTIVYVLFNVNYLHILPVAIVMSFHKECGKEYSCTADSLLVAA